MFTTSYKTTRKNFIKKVKEETDIDLSENDAKLLLSVSIAVLDERTQDLQLREHD